LVNDQAVEDPATEFTLNKQASTVFTYVKKIDFKSIVFAQLVTGMWAVDVLSFTVAKKLETLLKLNTDLEKHVSSMGMNK